MYCGLAVNQGRYNLILANGIPDIPFLGITRTKKERGVKWKVFSIHSCTLIRLLAFENEWNTHWKFLSNFTPIQPNWHKFKVFVSKTVVFLSGNTIYNMFFPHNSEVSIYGIPGNYSYRLKINKSSEGMWNKTLCVHYAGHLFSVSALLMLAAEKTCQSNKQEAKPSKIKEVIVKL